MFLNQQTNSAARLGAVAIGMVASFLLYAAYMVIPAAGFFSGLLAPFPAAFFRFRHGSGPAVIITLGTTTLLTAAFGIQAGALFLLQCGTISQLMPELLVRGYGATRSIAWTTAANMAVFAVAALAFSLVSGQNFHLLVVNEINSSIAQAISIYEKAGIKGDELALMKQSMSMAAGLIIKIYPAVATVMLTAMASLNLALVRRLAERLDLGLKIGDFNTFRNRDPLVWLLIAAGFAMMAGNPLITTPALNVLVIVVALYFLQGLAIVLTVISRQSFAGLMRVMLFLMLLFQPYLAALLAALGIFDLWGDFRTPRKQENL